MGKEAHQDTNLINGWGMARSSGSPWWVSDNGTGKSTLYNGSGVAQALIVSIPGAPTGVVFNGTSSFPLLNGNPARFLFASEDGTISGWNGGLQAQIVATTAGPVYKGHAIAPGNRNWQLYAAAFPGGHLRGFGSTVRGA